MSDELYLRDQDGEIERHGSAIAFCEHYGLIRAFIPFGHHESDPVEHMLALQDYLRDVPKTAQSVLFSKTGMDISAIHNWPRFDDWLHLSGSWDAPGQHRWANPEYCHPGPVLQFDSADDRDEYIREMALLGTLNHSDLCDRLGLSSRELRYLFDKRDIPWGELRTEGAKRLGRTVATVHAWTDYTYKDLARALDRPAGTLRRLVHTYVHTDEWAIPNEPTVRRGEIDSRYQSRWEEHQIEEAWNRVVDGGEGIGQVAADDFPLGESQLRIHLKHECTCDHSFPPLAYDRGRRGWHISQETETDLDEKHATLTEGASA